MIPAMCFSFPSENSFVKTLKEIIFKIPQTQENISDVIMEAFASVFIFLFKLHDTKQNSPSLTKERHLRSRLLTASGRKKLQKWGCRVLMLRAQVLIICSWGHFSSYFVVTFSAFTAAP
jgi:hypothetical protein